MYFFTNNDGHYVIFYENDNTFIHSTCDTMPFPIFIYVPDLLLFS